MRTSKSVRQRVVFLAIVLLGATAFTMPQAYPRTKAHPGVYTVQEPPNLGILQDTVETYIKSGAYEKGIAEVIDSAKSFIAARYKKAVKPAIVLDVDETSLSNLQFEYKYDFGYNSVLWNDWIKKSADPPIKPTLELTKWAARKHIAIFFITGRRLLSVNLSSDPTVINLKKAGYPDWKGIYFKSSRSMSTIDFKTSCRREISARGYTIIANIGDQYSDLAGGYAEGEFELPDPMYYIP